MIAAEYDGSLSPSLPCSQSLPYSSTERLLCMGRAREGEQERERESKILYSQKAITDNLFSSPCFSFFPDQCQLCIVCYYLYFHR